MLVCWMNLYIHFIFLVPLLHIKCVKYVTVCGKPRIMVRGPHLFQWHVNKDLNVFYVHFFGYSFQSISALPHALAN